MKFYDLTEFLNLSAVLNYQLSAKDINWHNVALNVLHTHNIPKNQFNLILKVFDYLEKVYGKRKRKLGSLAILHPLRATALLCRVEEEPAFLDVLTELLHDNFEDIKPKDFDPADWQIFDAKFKSIIEALSEKDRWYLMERLDWITKRSYENYYLYIGRLFDQSQNTPEVVRIKLADRLDNTFDMRIDIGDPLEGVDFYEIIFQLLFSGTYKGYNPQTPHSADSALNGGQRLYQLFKNVVLMSLIRQKQAGIQDKIVLELFENLARASIREAQRIVLHIVAYHETTIPTLRSLMIETMEYVEQGGLESVTIPRKEFRLDGLFVSRFDHPDKKIRHEKLASLYKDKHLMIEASIAFIVIFLNFMNDPDYYVRGISEKGVFPGSSNIIS